jgi:hypothetical protein
MCPLSPFPPLNHGSFFGSYFHVKYVLCEAVSAKPKAMPWHGKKQDRGAPLSANVGTLDCYKNPKTPVAIKATNAP